MLLFVSLCYVSVWDVGVHLLTFGVLLLCHRRHHHHRQRYDHIFHVTCIEEKLLRFVNLHSFVTGSSKIDHNQGVSQL